MAAPFVPNGEISLKNRNRNIRPSQSRGTGEVDASGRGRPKTSIQQRVKRLGFRQTLKLSLKMHRNTFLKMDEQYRTRWGQTPKRRLLKPRELLWEGPTSCLSSFSQSLRIWNGPLQWGRRLYAKKQGGAGVFASVLTSEMPSSNYRE